MSAIEICHTKENYMPRNDWPNQLSSYTLSHAIILDLEGGSSYHLSKLF